VFVWAFSEGDADKQHTETTVNLTQVTDITFEQHEGRNRARLRVAGQATTQHHRPTDFFVHDPDEIRHLRAWINGHLVDGFMQRS